MRGWASAAIFLGEPATSVKHGMFPNERPILREITHGDPWEAIIDVECNALALSHS